MFGKTEKKNLEGHRRNERDIMPDLLGVGQDEMKLILDENRTSVKLSNDRSESIELVQRSDGKLDIYVEGSYVRNMLREEFLSEIGRELEENYNYRISSDKFEIENKNLLAILIEIKAAIRNMTSNKENRIEN